MQKQTESSLRAYPINGYDQPYWGVTSILSYVFGFPEYLNRWSVKKGVEAIIMAEKTATKKLTQKQKYELAEMARLVVLEGAQKKGTAVHSHIEDYLVTRKKAAEVDPEYLPYYMAFLKFDKEFELIPVLKPETIVWSTEHRFAGRMDFYGWIVNRKTGKKYLCVLDFKTSRHLRSDYGLQLSAYAHCVQTLGHVVEKLFILHLKDDGSFVLQEYDDAFETFLDVRRVFAWKARMEKPEFRWATDAAAVAKELSNAPG